MYAFFTDTKLIGKSHVPVVRHSLSFVRKEVNLRPVFVMLHSRRYQPVGGFGRNLLYESCRNAAPKFAFAYHSISKHQRSCRNDAAPADVSIVEQGGTHAYEAIVVYSAAVNGGVMTYCNIVSYLYRCRSVGAVEDAAVL